MKIKLRKVEQGKFTPCEHYDRISAIAALSFRYCHLCGKKLWEKGWENHCGKCGDVLPFRESEFCPRCGEKVER